MSLFKTDMNVKTEETTGGKYIEMAHYLRLAGAAGARAENDYIPVPQSPRASTPHLPEEDHGRGRDDRRRDGEGGRRRGRVHQLHGARAARHEGARARPK
jgi:hypothetical protein